MTIRVISARSPLALPASAKEYQLTFGQAAG
jgi:hypothetical protein